MSVSTDSILAAFDALTTEQQRWLIEQLRLRMTAVSELRNEPIQEIEVLGGYDHTYDDQDLKLPLPPQVVSTVLSFTTRQQIKDYLENLADDEILWRYRFLQYRYLQDGTLWQVFAHAHIHRGTPSATRLDEKDLNPIYPPKD